MAMFHQQLRYLMTSRRLGLFLCLFGFVWGVTVLNMSLAGTDGGQDSEEIRNEILDLSERYVKTLAKETENTIDGPFAGRLTGYDLKKTMAVLLDSMMVRLTALEQRVDALSNHTQPVPRAGEAPWRANTPNIPAEEKTKQAEAQAKPVNVQGLIMGEQEHCELTSEESAGYPHCQGKLNWMKDHWKSDACYQEFGVDGSFCSFRVYLSEVETWCPLLPGRMMGNISMQATTQKKAELNLNLQGLMAKLHDPGQRKNYAWMRVRIEQLWTRWVKSAQDLAKKQDLANTKQKRTNVDRATTGGPLGELVQWSDIITALYILGHELTITSEVEQLQTKFSQMRRRSCQVVLDKEMMMIYTDIVGLKHIEKFAPPLVNSVSCLLRIIDSFGTEPAFNWEPFAKSHRLKTVWGMQNLNPQQFFTMFPHSPDNSFMGFVVENHLNDSVASNLVKKNQALVYGKAEYMWQEKADYVKLIQKYLEVHGTVFIEESGRGEGIPAGVKNHGILSGPDLHRLLKESKIFIGLGFPYEGPAPLEAIAQGCVFINPVFNPPHSSINNKFFKGKPTQRALASQHPYTQEFIGEPYVYTVDIANVEAVKHVIEKALQAHEAGEIKGFLPFEFTEQGMLQRLNAYIQHQDFCVPHPEDWPPEAAVEIVVGQVGRSCKDVCWQKNMICEPSHFKRANTQAMLEQFVGPCTSTTSAEEIYLPAFGPTEQGCRLQGQPMLFSCVGFNPELARICPCRDFIPGQTALCTKCL